MSNRASAGAACLRAPPRKEAEAVARLLPRIMPRMKCLTFGGSGMSGERGVPGRTGPGAAGGMHVRQGPVMSGRVVPPEE